jgi:2-oxoglutarate dehydrogenase E1 component
VLPDPGASADAQRVVLTSGKVYYDLLAAREKSGAAVPIIRLEQFYPFPQTMIVNALNAFTNAKEIVWAQEEPRNMGAWPFLGDRLRALLREGQTLSYIGRPVAAAPATGSHHRHEEQQKALAERALGIG